VGWLRRNLRWEQRWGADAIDRVGVRLRVVAGLHLYRDFGWGAWAGCATFVCRGAADLDSGGCGLDPVSGGCSGVVFSTSAANLVLRVDAAALCCRNSDWGAGVSGGSGFRGLSGEAAACFLVDRRVGGGVPGGSRAFVGQFCQVFSAGDGVIGVRECGRAGARYPTLFHEAGKDVAPKTLLVGASAIEDFDLYARFDESCDWLRLDFGLVCHGCHAHRPLNCWEQ
jgi:hypothetical protein